MLLYSRPVFDPLDILNDEWEAEENSDELVLLYVLSLRERLASMAQGQGKLPKAQRHQKAWYDMSAQKKYFQAGNQDLILLPIPTNKLKAQWQEPYPVL